MVTPPVIPKKDSKDPDYGKSMEHLQLEYLWLKAQADLVGKMPTWLKTLS